MRAWPHTVPATTRYHPLAHHRRRGDLGRAGDLAQGDVRRRAVRLPRCRRCARPGGGGAWRRLPACAAGAAGRRPRRLGGQYDPQTLSPAQGRSFELPSIAVQETVEVVRYLMTIPEPSPEVVDAIEGAVAWLEQVRIEGLRLETFELNRSNTGSIAPAGIVAVEDPGAPPLWLVSTMRRTTASCWPRARASAWPTTPRSRASAAPATTGSGRWPAPLLSKEIRAGAPAWPGSGARFVRLPGPANRRRPKETQQPCAAG